MSTFPAGSERRSRRRRGERSAAASANSEPLLLGQAATEDWYSGRPQRPSARRRGAAATGSVELTTRTPVSAYRPPRYSMSDLPVVDAQVIRERRPRQQQHRQRHTLLPALDQPNVNPAEDLAIPLFSNGCWCCQCVRTQEIGFTEQFGEFQEILAPGFHCMFWPMNNISGRLSLRIQQLDLVCETKTSDHVFVRIHIAVLFRVALVQAYDAYYRLSDPHEQIQTCVLDVVRSTVPSMTLDHVFAGKHEIAETLLIRLQQGMREYGYEISETLVTDVMPNDIVKAAMNEINVRRRLKEAAPYKAEALRVGIVTKAQAAAEGHYLAGVGLAKQRRALAKGLTESAAQWENDVRMVMGSKEVMDMLLVSQYFDVLTAVSSDSSMILTHGPRGSDDLLRANAKD